MISETIQVLESKPETGLFGEIVKVVIKFNIGNEKCSVSAEFQNGGLIQKQSFIKDVTSMLNRIEVEEIKKEKME